MKKESAEVLPLDLDDLKIKHNATFFNKEYPNKKPNQHEHTKRRCKYRHLEIPVFSTRVTCDFVQREEQNGNVFPDWTSYGLRRVVREHRQ